MLRNGQLKDIYKRRKDSGSYDSEDNDKLLQSLADNLPINNKDLRDLLSQTFRLDNTDPSKKKKKKSSKPNENLPKVEFNPKRYPTFFKLNGNKNGSTPVIRIPLSGPKTVQFDSDVENQFFDRVDDPGNLTISVMTHSPNDRTGGDDKGTVNDISELFAVTRKSPQEGKIKVVLKPTNEVTVGDEMQIKVDLSSPAHSADTFQEILWVKITEPLPKKPDKVPTSNEDQKLGLPKCVLVFKSAQEGQDKNAMTWENFDYDEMCHEDVMYPLVEGDKLDRIYINMDSSVFKNFKSKIRNISEEQAQFARGRYISSIYYHTIFLYVVSQQKKYVIKQDIKDNKGDADLVDYLRDVFSSHYAAFLLSFGTSELIDALH